MSKARGLADLGNVYNDGALSNRNLVINGAMQVAQRGTSFAGVTTNGYRAVDRFYVGVGAMGTHTVSQAADGPDGFSDSHKVEVTTADASPAVGDYMSMEYRLEGQDLQRIKKGTAAAETVTLSFWVKSNKTGTYVLDFEDISNARHINTPYTVDVSGTWEHKTITFAGDTSGSIISDNTLRARLLWWLGTGSTFNSGTTATSWQATVNANRNAGSNVNLADTIGNYFQITGVQLEVGDTATPFEHRSYGQELALCQRYYEKGTMYRSGAIATGSSGIESFSYLVEKRTAETLTATGTAFLNFTGVVVSAGGRHFNSYPTGGTSGAQGRYAINWTADAEL